MFGWRGPAGRNESFRHSPQNMMMIGSAVVFLESLKKKNDMEHDATLFRPSPTRRDGSTAKYFVAGFNQGDFLTPLVSQTT